MKKKNLELKVGIFVLLGLVSAGVLIVSFGRFGELFEDSYRLTVQFSNTSGVIKNSQVLYRGARVGTVATSPRIADQGAHVEIGVKINRGVIIDENSTFEVASYGLLGDRFIDVQPPEEPSGTYLEDGDTVQGKKSVGLSDIAEKMEPIADKLENIVASVEDEEIVANLGESMESVREITAKLDRILSEAENGEGPLHTILNDESTADNIKELVSEFKTLGYNLRKRGILFYKDLSEEEESELPLEKRASYRVQESSKR